MNDHMLDREALCEHGYAEIEHCIQCENLAVSEPKVSVTDDRLDELMKSQGRPSLATLYKQGKSNGLIKPELEYAHASA